MSVIALELLMHIVQMWFYFHFWLLVFILVFVNMPSDLCKNSVLLLLFQLEIPYAQG